ncbi:hypothetical protein ACSVBT_09970 [Afipia sp. TerB]|jgi:hypothetical protein
MRKLLIIAAGLILASTSLTFAQASRKSVTVPEAPAASGTPDAPVGHRQPRRDAVPAADDKGYQESAEDKALNRKIKSICRGC